MPGISRHVDVTTMIMIAIIFITAATTIVLID